MPEPLPADQVTAALADLPGWVLEDDALKKTFARRDFKDAFAFMTAVAFEAEALGHHPSWHNVYKTVTIELSTHDAGDKVTQLDLDLAQRIEAISG